MNETARPVVYVSRCLGIDHCRWNADMVNDRFVELLKDWVEFIDLCPEADIGLGIPRNPVRLVRGKGANEERMLQPATGEDCTEKMLDYCNKTLSEISRVDGFLLKNASPSCGINNIKLYHSGEKGSAVGKTSGMFARAAMDKFRNIPFEDEGRMHNYLLRENWLIGIFAIARLRELKDSSSIKALYDYHAQHKYLFMSFNQSRMREMGHELANHKHKAYAEIYREYEEKLLCLLSTKPSIPRRINVLMHMMGYFSKHLNAHERQYFLNLLEEYRRGAMPMTVPIEIIKTWALRFDNSYILQQVILQPYPRQLMLLTDSGKGRDLRK